MIPGGLLIARLTPDGKETLISSGFRQTSDQLGGIKGLAVGPDGSFYASYPKAVLKFARDGKVTTVRNPVVVANCDREPASGEGAPSLRGLTVDARGAVYVAATGCRCVIKITPDGHVQTLVTAQAPWTPTGVAVGGDNIFILEYNIIDDAAHKYVPRVRRLGPDGKLATLTAFAPDGK